VTTTVRIELKANQVYAYLADVPNGVARAASRALNSMNPDIRQQATDRITGIYNMRAKDAKAGVKLVSRSGPQRLRVVWAGKGRPIPLKSYSARVIGGGRRNTVGRAPVTVEVFKGKPKTVRGGFIGPNGHVFKRIGQSRLPIKKLHGPALPSQFANEQVQLALVSVTNRVLPGRLESEMVRELRKIETGRLPPLK
jgi:hypothetical protein